jgi:drug/metabolite transporter (DMT)-like permease
MPAAPVPATWLAPVLLLATGTALALSVLLAKVAALAGWPMIWFLATVMLGAGAILTGVALALGRLDRPGRLLRYALGAGALFALAFALAYATVERVGAAYVTMTMAFPLLFTWVMALGLGMDRFVPQRAVAVAAGLAGGLLLAGEKLAGAGLPGGAGTGAVVSASAIPVVLAAGNIFRTRYWPRGAASLPLAGLTMLAGGAVSAGAAMGWHGGLPVAPPASAALGLAAATAGVVALQMVLQFRLQAVAGPVYMSQIGAVAAVVGTALGLVWLGEALPRLLVPAAALIALGIAVFTWSAARTGPRRA